MRAIDGPSGPDVWRPGGRSRATATASRWATAWPTWCSPPTCSSTSPSPERFLDEMVRVTRPNGTVYLSFTAWYSPWGGHETAPWHYLGGHRAARRYERRHGCRPGNRFGSSLFACHVGASLRMARTHPGVEVVDARPRYYPDWLRWLVAVPVVREVATWNLLLVLRRRRDRAMGPARDERPDRTRRRDDGHRAACAHGDDRRDEPDGDPGSPRHTPMVVVAGPHHHRRVRDPARARSSDAPTAKQAGTRSTTTTPPTCSSRVTASSTLGTSPSTRINSSRPPTGHPCSCSSSP